MPEKIDWAGLKYTATQMGLSIEDFMKLHPAEFYEMVEYHIEHLERKAGEMNV